MSKVLAIITALLNLLDRYLTSRATEQRARTEQEIKENPRAFFERSNTNSKSNSLQSDSSSHPTKDE